MKKSKGYVFGAVSLSMVSALSLGLSNQVQAKETLKRVELGEKSPVSSTAKLHKAAGFAQYLPAETDLFFNLSKIENIVQYLRNSRIGNVLVDLAKKEGDDIDELMDSSEFKELLNVAGEEVFFSMGDGTGKLVKNTGALYSIYYQSYYSVIGEVLLEMYQGDDPLSALSSIEDKLQGVIKPFLNKMLELDEYKIPSTYVGFKVSNENDRKRYLGMIHKALKNAPAINDQLPGMEIPFEPEKSDKHESFEGVKIDQVKWMEQMLESPELSEIYKKFGMDEEYIEKYKEKFKDFEVSVLAGEYQDYIVIYFGNGVDELELVNDPATSLLSNPEMEFLNEYKDKEVVSISFVSKEVTEAYHGVTTFMQDISTGINKVLSSTDSLGDTKHVQALLSKIAKNGRKAVDLTAASRFGSVGFIEDGFKIDSFHGSNHGIHNLDAKRKLLKIAMRESAVFSANWVNDKEMADLNVTRFEDVINLIYQTTKMVVEHDQEVENDDFQEFAALFKMLDAQFSDELLGLWISAKIGMQQGTGNEGAILIDLEGKMPRVPDVPTVVLENGKIPRIAIGSDVISREKMAESWNGLNNGGKKIATKVEQLTGMNFNYRTPELAKKEGIDFWSYQLGITSHEANLALGINDKMAFVTTSPAFVESFGADYDEAGKEAGVDIKIRTKPVREFVKYWIDFIDKKGEEMGENFDQDDFLEAKKIADQCLKASEEIESLDYSVRKVDGEVRSFIHLNKAN